MKYILSALFMVCLLFSANAQFRIDAKLGIESPYRYLSSSIDEQGRCVLSNETKYLRTKLFMLGASYDWKIRNRWSLTTGADLAFLNQYMSERLLFPAEELNENLRFRSYSIEPRVDLAYRVFRELRLHLGAQFYLPIRKVFKSDQKQYLYDKSLVRSFYTSNIYFNVALSYDIEKFRIGLSLQDAVDQTIQPTCDVRRYNVRNGFIHRRNLQRWMFSVAYYLNT